MKKKTTAIQAAVVSLALTLSAGSAFATTHHVNRVRHHHHSRTRGTLVGAAAGAVIDPHHAVKGAIVGAAVGNAVQYERNKH